MKLTPLEIRKQEFRKTMRGLDPIEVQTFLDMVAEEYEHLAEENKSLNRRLIELETRLKDYQENEKNLRETLYNVQEVKKQSEESSRRQADLIIKEAELKALEVVEAARKKAQHIHEEVLWLKSQKESFINRLRHILVSQIELLSVMEIDDILPEESRRALRTLNIRTSRSGGGDTPKKKVIPDQAEAVPAPEKSKSAKGSADTHEERIIQSSDAPPPTTSKDSRDRASSADSGEQEDDINDFFKKGLQIEELIKTINKKDDEK